MTPKEAARLHKKLGSVLAVAQAAHCGQPKARQLIIAGGGIVERKLSRLSTQEMAELYRAGLSIAAIAKQAGISWACVLRRFDGIGLVRRCRGGRHGVPRTNGLAILAARTRLGYSRFVRLAAIVKSGGRCVQCGITDLRVLDLNHINGECRVLGNTGTRFKQYLQVLSDTPPSYLEVRCANCNRIHEYDRGNIAPIPPDFSDEVLTWLNHKLPD